jgi:outer membrane autotransporter protein
MRPTRSLHLMFSVSSALVCAALVPSIASAKSGVLQPRGYESPPYVPMLPGVPTTDSEAAEDGVKPIGGDGVVLTLPGQYISITEFRIDPATGKLVPNDRGAPHPCNCTTNAITPEQPVAEQPATPTVVAKLPEQAGEERGLERVQNPLPIYVTSEPFVALPTPVDAPVIPTPPEPFMAFSGPVNEPVVIANPEPPSTTPEKQTPTPPVYLSSLVPEEESSEPPSTTPEKQSPSPVMHLSSPVPDETAIDNKNIAAQTQAFVQGAFSATSQRLEALRYGSQSGMSAGNDAKNASVWSQAFGQRSAQGSRGGVAGYTANTAGMAFGADTQSLVRGATLGAAFSYGSSDSKSRNTTRTDTDIDSYQFSLYGDYQLPQGSFVKATAAYALHSVDTLRHDAGGAGLHAQGDFDSHVYSLRSEGGHDYTLGNMRLTPSLLAYYTRYDADSYTETGAGGGARVSQKALDTLELGANLTAAWNIAQAGGATLVPELRGGYRYDVIGDALQTSSQLLGGMGSYTTQGVDPARGTLSLGAGIGYSTANNWDFSARYEFERRADYTSNAGLVRAAYNF